MYTEYFNLKETPFKLTPDPKYLYLSENHNKAITTIAELLYTVKEEVGFAVVIGEVGTGKTTICRAFVNHLNRLKEKYQLAYIFNPSFDQLELYQALNKELGLPHNLNSKAKLHNILINHLIKQRRAGKSVILLVDEAQNLSPDVLEQIRLLSNLETETQKLIQIILVGQPELSDLLKTKSLRQLSQRISVRCFLSPLKYQEMVGYIRHRLKIAGGAHLINMFTKPALWYLYIFSHGIPRRINIVADRALLAAYSNGSYRINFVTARNCIKETAGFYNVPWFFRPGKLLVAFIVATALAGFGIFSNVTAPKAEDLSKPAPAHAAETPKPAEAAMTPGPTDEKPTAAADTALYYGVNGRQAAVDVMFETWAMPKVNINDDAFQTFARDNGLEVLTARLNLPGLRSVRYPAVLELEKDGKVAGYLPITGIQDGRLTVNPRRGESLPVAWLEGRWNGRAHFFWKDFRETPRYLMQGDQGASVTWLQRSLVQLGFADFKPVGHYGEETKEAVARFQQENKLKASGVLDPLTKMYIYRELPEFNIPPTS